MPDRFQAETLREIEREFWSGWRMLWIPRALAASLALVFGVVIYANRPVPPKPALPEFVVDSLLINQAHIMADVCHAWLRHDRTRRDSIESYSYTHTDPGTGKSFMCMNWLVLAGETP